MHSLLRECIGAGAKCTLECVWTHFQSCRVTPKGPGKQAIYPLSQTHSRQQDPKFFVQLVTSDVQLVHTPNPEYKLLWT